MGTNRGPKRADKDKRRKARQNKLANTKAYVAGQATIPFEDFLELQQLVYVHSVQQILEKQDDESLFITVDGVLRDLTEYDLPNNEKYQRAQTSLLIAHRWLRAAHIEFPEPKLADEAIMWIRDNLEDFAANRAFVGKDLLGTEEQYLAYQDRKHTLIGEQIHGLFLLCAGIIAVRGKFDAAFLVELAKKHSPE
jgi:hypothetical protein